MKKDRELARRRWLLWVALIALAGYMVPFLPPFRSSPPPARLTVAVDTGGVTRLGGVPLGGTNLRDGVFAAMGAAGMKVNFAAPAAFTNGTQLANTLETLKSMSRAGLFNTNPPPNPYE